MCEWHCIDLGWKFQREGSVLGCWYFSSFFVVHPCYIVGALLVVLRWWVRQRFHRFTVLVVWRGNRARMRCNGGTMVVNECKTKWRIMPCEHSNDQWQIRRRTVAPTYCIIFLSPVGGNDKDGKVMKQPPKESSDRERVSKISWGVFLRSAETNQIAVELYKWGADDIKSKPWGHSRSQ